MQSTSILFVLFIGLVALIQSFQISATDTITLNTNLSSGETLVSAGKRFELGFFQPGDGNNSTFLGIWYYNMEPRTVVWVANRNLPLLQVPGFLAISEDDGNVKVFDSEGSASYFQTHVESSAANSSRTLKLLDSGNLALFDDNGSGSGKYLWQSFSEPTDTFLPGMVMDESLKLVSWMDPTNPANGNFSFQEDEDNSKLFKIMKRSSIYWRSDYLDSGLLSSITCFFSKCTKKNSTGHTKIDPRYSFLNNRTLDFDYSKSRLLMNSSGEIQFYSLENNTWTLLWLEPLDSCSVFRPCGKFGLCSVTEGCTCLPGFDPFLSDDFSKGCRRKVANCNDFSKDQFLSLKMMNLEKSDIRITLGSSLICKQECFSNCHCEAYYYLEGLNSVECLIWTSEFNNLQEDYYTGHDLYLRLPDSAIELTRRDCEPCGKYIIPYPLSTGR